MSSSAVIAAAWTRMRYWVGDGVGIGVEVERERVDGGWKWRARIFLEAVVDDVIMMEGGSRVMQEL